MLLSAHAPWVQSDQICIRKGSPSYLSDLLYHRESAKRARLFGVRTNKSASFKISSRAVPVAYRARWRSLLRHSQSLNRGRSRCLLHNVLRSNRFHDRGSVQCARCARCEKTHATHAEDRTGSVSARSRLMFYASLSFA